MQAMVLTAPHEALQAQQRPALHPATGQLLLRVHACGVCRTDLHVQDGDLPQAVYPVVPGHEIVGTVEALGGQVQGFAIGDRVGVPWLGFTCGTCRWCLAGQENLCSAASFTGCSRDGGFAEQVLADAAFCLHLPPQYDDAEVAPLLCAGLIGYRALKMAGHGKRLGIYGFGAAAHIITQVACAQGHEVYAFTREGDTNARQFARELGACWAGASTTAAPEPLDSAIIFAPVGELVPLALKAVDKAGVVVCAGIHMSDIPAFPYALLWEERQLRSVANLTRQDATEFMELLKTVRVKTTVQRYPLAKANQAMADLRAGHVTGAAVLCMT